MNSLSLLPLLFASVSAFASADWVRMTPAGNISVEKFIDIKTIRQTGPMNTMRRVWEINNLPKRTANLALSVKQLMEYDCKDRRIRILEESYYSEHGALGERLDLIEQNDRAGAWRGLGKNSLAKTIFNRVCPNDGT